MRPAGEVGDGDPEQLRATDGARRQHRGCRVVLAARCRPHPAQHVLARARPEPRGVAEELHALGRLLEQVGREPAAGQGVRQPFGRRPLVAQQPQVPVGRAELVADLAEGEQAGIRVGLVGEPPEHDRQQLALDGGSSTEALGERLEVSKGAPGITETQRGQPLSGSLGGEPHVGVGQPRHGRQERPVEDPLVQAAHLALLGAPLRDDRLGRRGPVAQRAAQAPQVALGGRHQVRSPQPEQLDAVLERAQQPVRGAERRGVVAADVPAGGEGGQAVEGGAGAQRLVGAAVHELEELHRELHVAQPTWPELDLAVGLGRGDVLLDPATHGLHVVDEVLAARRLPHHGLHGIAVRLSDTGVPGDRPGLEQSLELPGLGPPLVVGAVAGDGAHEGAVLPLGPQRRVDLPQGPRRGRRRADPHQPGREVGGDDRRLVLGHPVSRLGGEDDVDVGDVVQLAATGLAHRDDREAGAVGIRTHLGASDREGRLQRRLGEVGQRARGLRQGEGRVGGGEVERRDAEQLLAVGRAQHVRGRHRPISGDRVDQATDSLVDGHRGGVGHRRPVLGVGAQVVAEGGRAAEHGEHPLACGSGGTQGRGHRGAQAGLVRHGLHEPDQPEEGAVGVGHLAERRRQPLGLDVVAAVDQVGEGRVVEQALGPGRVREPEPGDGDRDRPRAPRAHRRPSVTGAAGSARARRRSPGCGSRPTRRACCAGRTRRCARPGSRRRARCPPWS